MSRCELAFRLDQQVDRAAGGPRGMPARYPAKRGDERFGDEKRLQLAALRVFVAERKVSRLRLEEKIERIADGHLGHEVHLDAEFVGPSPGTRGARRSCSADPAAS